MSSRHGRGDALLVITLLGIDAVLVSTDVLYRGAVLADARFSLGFDRGFGEMFEYAKLAATAILLARVALRWHSWTVLFWSAFCAYLLIDNAFEVHEHMGERLARWFGLPTIGSVRARDVGELIVYSVLGAIAVLGIGAGLLVSSFRERRLTWLLSGALVALAFFGVAMDVVHRLVTGVAWLEPAAAIVEDGGELLAMSALLWIVARTSRQTDLAPV